MRRYWEYCEPSRVLKKGNKSENRANSEARRPTILTTDGVFQHPASPAITIVGVAVYESNRKSKP